MILTTAAIVAQATAAPAVTDNAKAWFAALQAGKLLDADQLDQQMKDLLTPSALQSVQSLLKDTGAPKSFDQTDTRTVQGLNVYVFKITFDKAAPLDFIYALDAAGKIAGLRFVPAQ
jgi:hypothetical protein